MDEKGSRVERAILIRSCVIFFLSVDFNSIFLLFITGDRLDSFLMPRKNWCIVIGSLITLVIM